MEPNTNTNAKQEQKVSKKGMYIAIGVVAVVLIGWLSTRGMGGPIPGVVDVDRNFDGSATFTTEEGKVTMGTNKLPENWPSDAPTYPRGDIQYSGSSNPQTGEAGITMMFLTTDNEASIVEFYKKELATEGWAIEQTMTFGEMTVLAAKKDERIFSVQIAPQENGQTAVTIAIAMP